VWQGHLTLKMFLSCGFTFFDECDAVLLLWFELMAGEFQDVALFAIDK
jgi:hypothetical protein